MGRPPKADLSARLLKLLHLIGSNLAALRDEQSVSQADLARLSKVSLTTINEMEARRCRDVRLSTLSSIAQALDVPLTRLFAKSDLDLNEKDRAQLLQASEAIARITRKLE